MNKTIKWINKNILKKKRINHTNTTPLSYICPNCHQQTITLENEIVEDRIITCPKCGQKGIIRPLQKNQNTTNTNASNLIINLANVSDERKKINVPTIEVKILGILLIFIGLVLHFIVNLISLKISFLILIIGVIIFTFIPSHRKIFINFYRNNTKEKPDHELKTHKYSFITNINNSLIQQFDISEKIAITLILWIIFIYALTGVNDIDLFFIFVYLGILFMKVFSTEYISSQLKKRINVFTIAFLFIFLIIIMRRIISIISI